jgi:chloramphenicol-sensitive protein RarD
MMTPHSKGLIAIFAALTVWGLSPLYYKLLVDVPATEVLAHRTIWSWVTFVAILALRGRLRTVGSCLNTRAKLLLTGVASCLISVNWFGFIYAVQSSRAMEASLGYYIFPLVAVLLGVLFDGNRMRVLQWLAVGLAASAVGLLTAGLGEVPGISLMLAVSFGIYGLMKKRMAAEAMGSVTAEVSLLVPFALVWLAGVHLAGWGGAAAGAAAFGRDPGLSALLAVSGLITGLPLILFSYASQRLTLPTLGLVSYCNPTLQFLIATLIFMEPFTVWHAVAFPLIWTALALYSWDGWRNARRASIASATSAAILSGVVSEAGASSSATTWRRSDSSGSQ